MNTAALTKKVGPLPVWGYGAIAGVGALFLFMRARGKSGATTTSADTAQTQASSDGYNGPWTGSQSSMPGGPGTSSYGTDNSSNPQQSPQGTTNLPTAALPPGARKVGNIIIPAGQTLLHGKLYPIGTRAVTDAKGIVHIIPPGYSLVSGKLIPPKVSPSGPATRTTLPVSITPIRVAPTQIRGVQ